ncbi:MAG: YlxM family DNA-binding protein [Lachnospiraceae bacterium]|nr:YlxM family DNA-binding protein [Lachnospiraceae bacterium]
MEKIYQQALLYDFYGELLTEHQRSIYEDAVCNDLSLGEIAQERGISRQGVHDLIRRCDRILQEYEAKLHLVEKFVNARESVEKIIALTEEETEASQPDRLQEIHFLAMQLRNEL